MNLQIQDEFIDIALACLNAQDEIELLATFCRISDELAMALALEYHNNNLDDDTHRNILLGVAYLIQQNQLEDTFTR